MAHDRQFARAESALRKHALSFPQSVEEFPWEHSAFKVNGKVFLFLYREKGLLSLSMKLPVSGRHALSLPFASPTGYGLGKSGWVTAKFTGNDDMPVEILKEWVDESFRAIAPKKLVATLEAEPAESSVANHRARRTKGSRR